MNTFTQMVAVVSMNLRSLPQRVATSAVVVLGIGGVVGVLISVLSLSGGLANALASTGRPDRAIVMHSQTNNEVGSQLPRDEVLTIEDEPGIAHSVDGKPIASGEMIATVNVPRRDNGLLGALTLRGISAQAMTLRPEIKLVEGRMFSPGLRELIAGRQAQERFKGLTVGSRILFGENEWSVVGAFEGGGAHDSELFSDGETVLSAYQRTSVNSVTVKLDGATKELFVWGLRCGFLTFAPGRSEGAEAATAALDAKVRGAIRGAVSNSPQLSQTLVEQALVSSSIAEERQQQRLADDRDHDGERTEADGA